MLTLALSGMVLGVEAPDIAPGDSEPKYNIDGSFVVAGTTDGAEIQSSSFDYDTTESRFGFSFIGPDSSLAFGGADNVDVNMRLINDEGVTFDRYSTNIGDIDTTGQKTVDFEFSRKPAGSYTLEADLQFECTAITYQCDNVDNFSTGLEVPR